MLHPQKSNPIANPAIPFHTVAMDFICALPVSKAHNFLRPVTCEFTKRILLLPGHDTWDAPQWANTVIVGLVGHDWGIAKTIASDRDSKFHVGRLDCRFRALGCVYLNIYRVPAPEGGSVPKDSFAYTESMQKARRSPARLTRRC